MRRFAATILVLGSLVLGTPAHAQPFAAFGEVSSWLESAVSWVVDLLSPDKTDGDELNEPPPPPPPPDPDPENDARGGISGDG